MRYEKILVVGGSGFIGSHLVAALAARGVRVVVPARRRERAKHLTLLPTVEVIACNVMAPDVLDRLADGCDAVINLAGVLHSRRGRPDERGPNDYGPDFALVHVELAQAVVSACRGAGVRRLLHMSALGADAAGPSEYLRSKGIGEQAVRAADDLDTTVFRPSVVFGPGDGFLNLFAGLAKLLPVIVLACPDARFQPVYVGDVVAAFMAALDDRATIGARYDLCGPRIYSLEQLVRYVCDVTGHRRMVVGLSDGLSMLQAWFMEWSPVPLLTRDNVRSMQVPSVCACEPPLGIVPRTLETIAPTYLAGHAPRERYSQLRGRSRR